MNHVADITSQGKAAVDWIAVATALGEEFAGRAARYDQEIRFVDENYRLLREHRFFSAGIPVELGGGGATHAQLCGIVRTLGRHCGSTGLAFCMHTHPVATNVFKHRRGDERATATLRRLAENELVIAGTGANDWLHSNGTARRIEGGYRVTARKRFVSGAPGADVFVTSSVVDEGEDGPEVIHFAVPFRSEGVEVIDTWRTLGMRGTGSHDVALDEVFVADEAIVARRPAGVWHPLWDVILPIALPLITSCYVGLAEAAVALAVASVRQPSESVAADVGDAVTELADARMALEDMIRLADGYRFTPAVALTNDVLIRKTLATRAVNRVVDRAATIVGGAGFFQDHPIERIVRDVRAMTFHPLPERRQHAFSGRLALGMTPAA